MPTTHPRRRIIFSIIAVALVAAVISVLTMSTAPVFAAATLLLGALPFRRPDALLKASVRTFTLYAAVPVVLAVAAGLIDNTWISPMVVVLAAIVVALAWRMVRRSIAPGEVISSTLNRTLTDMGVRVAEEATAGWTSGVSQRGAVILVREVVAAQGPVESWPQLAALKPSASATSRALADQSITPHMIVVATQSSSILHKASWVTVCSPDKLATVVKSLTPSIADPVALAAQAGITLSRDVARRASRISRPSTSSRPQHHGRVTPKKPRPTSEE